jgi:rhodanese-related sulfurtransferase
MVLPEPKSPQARPTSSLVLQVPAAEPEDAERHFLGKLAFETDPSDVHADLGKGGAGFVVLDCRRAEQYAEGHIPGALNLPYRNISADGTAHLPRDKTLVTYCSSVHCNASTKAALQLSALGFKVKEMVGGMAAWRDEGYAVATGADAGAPARVRLDRIA